MFVCIRCTVKYTLKDVERGGYFPSSGICLACYQVMEKDKNSCFGDKRVFDPNTLACGQECPDRRICRGFIKHPKEFT